MMMRSETVARVSGVLVLALLTLPERLLATCDPGCGSSDPCVVSSPITVDNGCTIDVGARELRIASGGVLDVGTGTMTLKVGTLTVQTGGFLRARGDNMMAVGGTINIVAGNVSIAPDPSPAPTSPIDASGATGGTISIAATAAVTITGSVTARALNVNDEGGTVQISAATATVSAPISVLGGPNAGGANSISIDTGGDLTVNSTLQASGGDPGGTIEVSTTAGNLVVGNSGVLRADATFSAGSGGEIDFAASGDGITTGLATINGLLSAVGVAGSADTGGGDGGCICIEAEGDLHMDLASAEIIADAGAPDGTGGEVDILDDTGGMTMPGTVSAAVAGTDSGGGDVCIETSTDLTISGSILLSAGSGGGGQADLTSDQGNVSIAQSGKIAASGSSAGDGGSISLCAAFDCSNGTDPTLVQAVLVEGTLVADGDPGGGAGGAIALEGNVSVRVSSTGSLHASGGSAGGTLSAAADSGVASIEGPMTAAGGGPNGPGGVLSVDASGRISVSAPLNGSGFGNGGMVGIGHVASAMTTATTGPLNVSGNITVASSTAAGGTIELMDEGDVFVAGTLVSTGVVAPTDSSQIGIDILGCNVILCGMDAQSCPAGSTGVLTSLGPSGVNRVTDRNSAGIFGNMNANQSSGSNDLVYDGNVKHKPLVLGQVKPVQALTVNAALMPCPICGDGITEPPETCDDGNTNDGDGCSSSCQKEASLPGDANGDHSVTIADIGFLDGSDGGIIAEIFDGDGDSVTMVSGGSYPGAPGADANGDGVITAADITATLNILFPAP